MTQPTSPRDDLQDWLDQLAGRQPADPISAALRNAVLQRQAEEELELLGPPDPAELKLGLDRLLTEVRQQPLARPQSWLAKLLRRPGSGSASSGTAAMAHPLHWSFAAAGVIVVAIVLRLAMQGQPGTEFQFEDGPPPVLRSGEEQSVLQTQDAERSARHLAAIAAEFAGRPALYRVGPRFTVDFEVNPDLRPAMQTKVDGLGLPIQLKDGLNRIVLMQ